MASRIEFTILRAAMSAYVDETSRTPRIKLQRKPFEVVYPRDPEAAAKRRTTMEARKKQMHSKFQNERKRMKRQQHQLQREIELREEET